MSLLFWTPFSCDFLGLGYLKGSATIPVMADTLTLCKRNPHTAQHCFHTPDGLLVHYHRDLICPGCLPYPGAFLTPPFHSAQCFLSASVRRLVLALSLKENVSMVRCAVCEWMYACHGECSCRCWSSPSAWLQVGPYHFCHLLLCTPGQLAHKLLGSLLSLPSVGP